MQTRLTTGFTLLALATLAVNACGGSSRTIDDDSMGGRSAVSSGGNSSSRGGQRAVGQSGAEQSDTGHGGLEQGGTAPSGSPGGAPTSGAGGSHGGVSATGGTRARAGSGGSLAGSGGTAEAAGEAGATTTGENGGASARGGHGGKPSGAGGSRAGRGGSAGKAGESAGSAGASPGTATLGAACVADDDCAGGLVCLTADTPSLGGAAPPNGLCSRPCNTDDECSGFANDAHCVALDPDATKFYCIEGCTTGAEGVPKCHDRPDVACTLVGLHETTKSCATSDDCGDRQLCDTAGGACRDEITGCLPMCAGDFDCTPSQYCDFGTGMCMTGQPTGLALGSACDPSAQTDACGGFCISFDAAGGTGTCSGFCTVRADWTGCGWNGMGPADSACLITTVLAPSTGPSLGDVGVCGALCDCNDDCTVATERCMDDGSADFRTLFDRAGYCRPLQASETQADSIACN